MMISAAVRAATARLFPDAALIALALAISAHAFALPYGHDQGLYHYVAREWVERGSIPYRDVFDHKTPGIYLIFAAAIGLFGPHLWSIRTLEIPCVFALGAICAWIVTPRGERPARGVTGVSVLAAAGLHYGLFNYWDTAQSEIWFVMFGIASACAVMRARDTSRGAIVGGVLAGVALVVKPPAIWFVLLAVALLVRRTRRSGPSVVAKQLVLYALGASCPVIATLAYFAAHGAIPAMVDIVVKANSYYVLHESGVQSAAELFDIFRVFFLSFFPLSLVLPLATLISLGRARRRRDAARFERHALVIGVAVAALGALVMQKKFYSMHWVGLVGPGVMSVSALAADLLGTRAQPSRAQARRLASFVLVLAAVWFAAPAVRSGWLWENSVVWDLVTGKLTRDQYAGAFVIDDRFYSFQDVERTGDWLREHSAPADSIAVRGFNPEVYAVAQRHYAGRFFWTPFLTYPTRLYRRQDYLQEDEEAQRRTPPRYIVAMSDIHAGLDSVEWYLERHYRVAIVFGKLTILEPAGT